MTPTPRTCRDTLAANLENAFELFEEYINRHGYEGGQARDAAIAETLETSTVRCADMGRDPCADCRGEDAQRAVIAALAGALGNWECGTCGGPLSDPPWDDEGIEPCEFCVEARAALELARKA